MALSEKQRNIFVKKKWQKQNNYIDRYVQIKKMKLCDNKYDYRFIY